jgi:uncharacterized protein (DUF58 family)
MTNVPHLRSAADALAAPLPPLLAEARHLASTVLLGAHGRRRAGMGDEFWQYRQAGPGDSARSIDWRRSARADGAHFVREKEWQAAQTVTLWVDPSASMSFASAKQDVPKSYRAQVLGLALATLLIRGGERVGLSGADLPPRSGEVQLDRMASALIDREPAQDFGLPPKGDWLSHSRAVFISDFFGDIDQIEASIAEAADRGVTGVILQVLDPEEEDFSYDGRTRFQSMAGVLEFETLKAGALRDRYLGRLTDLRGRLESHAQACGWQFAMHRTDAPAMGPLVWLYQALEGLK